MRLRSGNRAGKQKIRVESVSWSATNVESHALWGLEIGLEPHRESGVWLVISKSLRSGGFDRLDLRAEVDDRRGQMAH